MRNNEKNMLIGLAILLFATIGGTASAIGIDEVKVGYSQPSNDTIQVYVTALNADSIGDLQLSLSYDPSVLEIQNIENGDLISGNANANLNTTNDTNKIMFDANSTNGFSGSGSIARITFKVISGGTSPLDINVDNATDTTGSDATSSIVKVTDSQYPMSATSTPTENVTATETATEEPTESVTATETTPEETIPTGTTPEETTVAPTTPQSTPGFEGIMSIMGVMAALIIIYKRR